MAIKSDPFHAVSSSNVILAFFDRCAPTGNAQYGIALERWLESLEIRFRATRINGPI
jgi:hypothetical protein